MIARPGYGRVDEEPRFPGATTFEQAVRRTSIRWRILAIALFNSVMAAILLILVWNGARVLNGAWQDVQRVRQSERFLTALDTDAERLQSLIHRYIAQNDPDIHARIIDLNENLISRLRVQARLDPLIAEPSRPLAEITERFISGFDDLRSTRSEVAGIYDRDIVRPSRELTSLYGRIADQIADPASSLASKLNSSREAYNSMILAANAFYLSGAEAAAREASGHAREIAQDAAAMAILAEGNEDLRKLLSLLGDKATQIREGIGELAVDFAKQVRLLREAIDGNARAMSATIDAITAQIHDLEQTAQVQFDRTLQDVAVRLSLLAAAFLALVVLMSLQIAKSISEPLRDLGTAMQSITTGVYTHRVAGLSARDEVGEMARSVEVFRENAIAKRRAEDELRHAKDGAEEALAELRATQASLIAAEKLAALGSLVAGVAHEVNNPVGISLTVASSMAQRCEAFSREVESGQIRRSKLDEFVRSTRMAAGQLVTNLLRAGELVQSFKQVAVDRSQAERRSFDLGEATEQILTSLKPTLKTASVALEVRVPEGVQMDSYPGPLGQIFTNLFLNALHHGFPDGEAGTITVDVRRKGDREVEIAFADNGRGMTDDVRRCAFDPFFTTRRGSGGTGLGLHIVHNLVMARLGGRMSLTSSPGEGSTFLIVLPIVAPRDVQQVEPRHAEVQHV